MAGARRLAHRAHAPGRLAASVGGALNDDYSLPGTGAQRATDLLEEKFPAMSGADARIVAHDDGPVDGAALAATVDRAKELPNVTSVSPPLLSDDRRTALISIQYGVPVTDITEGVAELERASTPLRDAWAGSCPGSTRTASLKRRPPRRPC